MARSRLCRACRDFHDLDRAWPVECASHFGHRGEDAGFYVQSDSMSPIQSMADGKWHDSKSVYRRDLKARGLVEVGNDKITQRRVELPPVRETLRQAYQQLRG